MIPYLLFLPDGACFVVLAMLHLSLEILPPTFPLRLLPAFYPLRRVLSLPPSSLINIFIPNKS